MPVCRPADLLVDFDLPTAHFQYTAADIFALKLPRVPTRPDIVNRDLWPSALCKLEL
jgi:hypothetical protein